ncbi:phosphoenolpyruvate--protein phosphotransferase [Inmirania thermothiophila]|uniref:Phosphoenolpyruvate-protein phosphotransferase n=1 Tax=Inmirania thermothiophila TaxID=1750597 RepID=A0A3N1XU96_9GAMM|nr:phosphoenolpyruvate--protein phosphotransferase [Inmirania thermothiophila]ROR29751.1 phosphoenolpyruvate--protein phosphotransferase [Inmirania thermothiophila]
MVVELGGIGVARGIAIGPAHVVEAAVLEAVEYCLPRYRLEAEVARYRRAVEAARAELRAVREQIPPTAAADIRSFIDTHLLMLDDATLTTTPERLIRERRVNAEWALKMQRDALVQVFEEMDDPYLRTRRDDVDHVVGRIQRLLAEGGGPGGRRRPQGLDGRVVVAEDLTPADLVLMHQQGIAALVTERGGPLSHTAILARSLRIPAVAGVRGARRLLREGETLVVDGAAGCVLATEDAAVLRHYRRRQREVRRREGRLRRLRRRPATTRDGERVALMANIELPEDVAAARDVGAEGVGLYRTEFLFMNRRDLPDEEEHYETYRQVLRELRGLPLTIRTLDLGADKQVDGRGAGDGAAPPNPALGLRAVRLCLREPGLFLPQVRAILRVAAEGPVRMMIPMLSSPRELAQVLALVDEARAALAAEGAAFDPHLPVGGMIEVPAAAVAAGFFARRLDFLSIGTNDLIQYTLAIDRVDDAVSHLYDPLHPAVLRLVHQTIAAGRRAGVPVALCGEMAGEPRYTRLLLGLGLRELSMHPTTLLEIKEVVAATEAAAAARIARRILRLADPDEIAALLGELNADLF